MRFLRMGLLFPAYIFCSTACVPDAGVEGEEKDDTETPEVPEPVVLSFLEQGRPKAYTDCQSDDDCAEGVECVALLGTKICTLTGCATGTVCPGAGLCVVSEALDPTGICAAIGGDPFCSRNCRDILACNLNAECAERGCCNDVAANGCSTACSDLDPMDCEISPQCPSNCCTSTP